MKWDRVSSLVGFGVWAGLFLAVGGILDTHFVSENCSWNYPKNGSRGATNLPEIGLAEIPKTRVLNARVTPARHLLVSLSDKAAASLCGQQAGFPERDISCEAPGSWLWSAQTWPLWPFGERSSFPFFPFFFPLILLPLPLPLLLSSPFQIHKYIDL